MKILKIVISITVVVTFVASNSFALSTPYASRAKRVIEQSYSRPVPVETANELEKKYFPVVKPVIGPIQVIDLYSWATSISFSCKAGSGNSYSAIYSKAAQELQVKRNGPTAHSWTYYTYNMTTGTISKSYYGQPPFPCIYHRGDAGYAAAKQEMRDYCNTGIQRFEAGEGYMGSKTDFQKALIILAD